VAAAQAAGFRDLDTFFSAWAGVAPSLEQAIVGGPPALRQATYSLPYEAPFIRKSTEFMRLLRPSARDLRTVAPQLGEAFSAGAVNLRAAAALNQNLAESSQAFQAFAENPLVPLALEDLTQTTELGGPLFAGIAPEQAYCNYVTLMLRNVANMQTENIGIGTLARAAVVLSPLGPNAEGFPSAGAANGPSIEKNSAGEPVNNNFLHFNPYPNVAGPGQPRLCEAGNEEYLVGKQVAGNVPAGSSSNKRELTTREQNLFGERYPSATLQALGLSTKTSSKGKKKSSKGKKA
jgi:phospholipid/cholesterol/gamma-HCH transport system substrate-binding protein